ncbi:phosphoglucomutase, alpha-D-glucose phosphate-specific [Candidatus Saccharibacteria bacterium]|nr:phosphoglucomutase, alpha-D-glucose phosphate-specific [Candidatus Saccharibacteria bacterium]
MSSRAGELPQETDLINIKEVLTAYYDIVPDVEDPAQKVAFGTSGHRGKSTSGSFNEAHLVAIAAALIEYRQSRGLNGPIFVGIDTHLLSLPAFRTTLEVFAGAGVEYFVDNHITEELLEQAEAGQAPQGCAMWTPTPAISRAIISYNQKNDPKNFEKVAKGEQADLTKLADGIVITPSHNPPTDGGFKYNPEHGGAADTDATNMIQARANEILETGIWKEVVRADFATALEQAKRYDFRKEYVKDLKNVVDMTAIAKKGVRIAADSLGGAAIDYWPEIARVYNLNLTEINDKVDPRFPFLTLDHDEKIRMDCSSKFAMNGTVERANLSANFDIVTGNDGDADRHGIVSRADDADEFALMNPNYYLAVAVYYLWQNRPDWFAGGRAPKVGKTLVSSRMIDYVAKDVGADLVEMPVGMKWFVGGLLDGSFGFGGEESAGASFLNFDGEVWTTDKDGITLALLAAEILARTGKSPAEIYVELTEKFGESFYERLDVPATLAEKAQLKDLNAENVKAKSLAGEKITKIETTASGFPIGGLKVNTQNAWFAARPSGTENIYKIYAESFISREHLRELQSSAKELVASVLQ